MNVTYQLGVPQGRRGEATQPRLLHLIASVDLRAGGPVEGLRRQHEITRDRVYREVATLDPCDAPFLSDFPIKVHALGAPNYYRKASNPISHFGFTPRLVPWLKANIARFDAVVVHGLWNYASVAGALTLSNADTPYYVFTHGMLDPWFRQVKPAKHLIKQLSWLAFEGRLLRGARAVFFTSEEELRRAAGGFLGHGYKGEVVSYGAADVGGDPQAQQAAFQQACPKLGGRPYLLFLGRIHPKKGCDLLLRAFADIAAGDAEIQLVMAGPDDVGWGRCLRDEAGGSGVGERIHWLGMLQGDAKWGAFRGAQAFVLPSHQENFGIAVAESLACSTPVLITDKVNIWREIEADGAGLVSSDDQPGVTALLHRWRGLSAEDQARMRGAARASFDKRFDVRSAATALVDRISRG